MRAARSPAFLAPFNATVATGIPPGICKIDKIESQPSIEFEDFKGIVYNISVEDTHNYIAEGILVHNAVKKFE